MKVLFVCTGNIFRSMSAELMLKKAMPEWDVSSAGIVADLQEADPSVKDALESLELDCSRHVQRKVTAEMLNEADIVIPMHSMHQKFLQDNFGVSAKKFFEWAWNKPYDLMDVNEIVSTDSSSKVWKNYCWQTVLTINGSIPALIKRIEKEHNF